MISEVRHADVGDIELIAEISAENLHESWSAGSLRGIFENAAYRVFVCGRLGYIIISVVADECSILSLGVSAGSRRRGIGRALTEAAAACARECDCSAVYLEVRASNAPAVKLYESCGFEYCGKRPGFYQNPAEDAKLYKFSII